MKVVFGLMRCVCFYVQRNHRIFAMPRAVCDLLEELKKKMSKSDLIKEHLVSTLIQYNHINNANIYAGMNGSIKLLL